MDDLISRRQAIDVIDKEQKEIDVSDVSAMYAYSKCKTIIKQLPSALGTNLAEVGTDVPDINVGDINKFIDSLEEIFADIRERHVDDSVCGLCEYDGAYIGQSGDWCNECPGFDRDDCFKLSDKCRKRWIDTITKALPSEQPEPLKIDLSGYSKEDWERFRKEWANVPIMALPKRGRWERHYSRPNVYADLFWHCSECGYRSSDNWADKFNFCPNCGAKMEVTT